MRLSSIVTLYVLFAGIAIIVNLGVQRVILNINESYTYFLFALFSGTFAGLFVKYVLDRRWIFSDHSSDLHSHSRKFSLYALMGIATTVIFWGIETVFWLTWKTDVMRELGAVIGLSIGYIVKYNLDLRFVFTESKLRDVT